MPSSHQACRPACTQATRPLHACRSPMELIIHSLCCWRVALIVTIYINTERPLDGVNGPVRRSYIGLAEYPVARPGIRLVLCIEYCQQAAEYTWILVVNSGYHWHWKACRKRSGSRLCCAGQTDVSVTLLCSVVRSTRLWTAGCFGNGSSCRVALTVIFLNNMHPSQCFRFGFDCHYRHLLKCLLAKILPLNKPQLVT